MPDKSLLTDQNILDGIDAAGYGMNSWADRAVIDDEAKTYTVHVPDGPEGTEETHVLTFEKLRDTFFELVDLDQDIVGMAVHDYFINAFRYRTERDGIEMGCIDAEAGDCWIQTAIYGELVFG